MTTFYPETMMTSKHFAGIHAAVLTPRDSDDRVDEAGLRVLLEFLLSKGISKFALNGATGEFCLTTPDQLRAILSAVERTTQGKAEILCGVGAAGTAQAVELAAIAEGEGANGLLLPMPYFFPYEQDDLEAFSRTVAGSTTLPVLLYNLPQFTSGLDKATVHTLISDVPNIVGIKDSSGSLDILRHLTEHNADACRIVGNDSALASALRERTCDGVVSGVACVMPELVQALYAQAGHTGSEQFAHASTMLDEFIHQLNLFPTPWGLKWIAEARGIIPARFSQPVSPLRRRQAEAMSDWFATWYDKMGQAEIVAR